MSLTNFLETEVLDHVFGGNAYTAPTTLYFALFTAAPSDTGGGTEVSGTNYERVSGAFTVSGNTASLTSAIEFAAAGSNWGTVTHGAIFDAATSGNMLAYGTLADDKVIETGDVLRIQANQFTITLD